MILRTYLGPSPILLLFSFFIHVVLSCIYSNGRVSVGMAGRGRQIFLGAICEVPGRGGQRRAELFGSNFSVNLNEIENFN